MGGFIQTSCRMLYWGERRMIYITKLNDKEVVINCELIESIEANPDTTITMTNGKKYFAKESVDELVRKTIEYKQKINETGRVERM